MKIKKTLSKLVSFDDRESKYIYRVIENTVKNRQAFGIEIERQDLNCGEVINYNIYLTKEVFYDIRSWDRYNWNWQNKKSNG